MSRYLARALYLTLAAVAFGVIEGAVVVYIREISYPEGFSFPLRMPPDLVLRTELIREAATLLLLIGIAGASARTFLRRMAVFVYSFGIWDLVYYATLKVVLDWPESLMSWDVLFLIPLPWTAPVLAPVLVSVALVSGGFYLLLIEDLTRLRIRKGDWIIEILAALILLASFLWNAGNLSLETPDGPGTPDSYPWWLFGVGWLLGVSGYLRAVTRRRSE